MGVSGTKGEEGIRVVINFISRPTVLSGRAGWMYVCMYICMRMNACNAVVVYGVMYPALSAKCRLPPSPRGALHRCVYAFSWVKNV